MVLLCKSIGERRGIEHIPPEELNKLLGHFFMKVKQKNGEMYELDTLTSFHHSFHCYLTKEKNLTFNIPKDLEFTS